MQVTVGGVFDPYTDVTLMLTSRKTGRSVSLTSIERTGHYPPIATGPRLAADGSLIVYNPDSSGSNLYRVDTTTAKPRLRLIARRLAVADVDGRRIVGWRGNGTLVTLRADGRVLGTTAASRSTTGSIVLDGTRLFTTTNDSLSLTNLDGRDERTWRLVDEGGPPPTLAGVDGDLVAYVSGVAVHVLRLSTGRDVVLELVGQGTSIEAALTHAGLFYAYTGAYTRRPGRLGYVAINDLAQATSR